MPQNVSSISLPKLNVFFQSHRASIEGQSNAHLVQFIKSAKKTLDCAIYDFKQQDVLDALKSMSKKVKLRIGYDGGKKKAVTGGAKADPKPPGTEDALRKAGLLKFATAIHTSGGHLMHSKYIVRDSSAVWTGSGNWTHGGLELQDNNFLAIDSVPLAAAYTTNFESLLATDHTHPAKPKKVSANLVMARPPIKVGFVELSLFFSGSGTEEIETAVIALIQKARKLRIIAMLISDPSDRFQAGG
jgi:phosphatidylserine/phosphatidylglycerophosphate/cardiolipin synthase-like enzyme